MGLAEPLHKFAANQFVTLGREHRLLPLIRRRLAAAHVARLGLKVLHGPMTGFELAPGAVWGESDHLLKLLGLYEQPLLTAMAVGGPWRRFYNVGAADGFYGVGMLTAGLAEASICWEMEAASRTLIAQTARLNGETDRITVFGEADETLSEAEGDLAPGAGDLVLVDIEGFEYTLLSDEFLSRCADATVMVELHPFLVDDGAEKEAALIARASVQFDVSFIDDCMKDLTGVDELRACSDDERWLLCSEAREAMMRWMVLKPKG